jgi:hypothetical protein
VSLSLNRTPRIRCKLQQNHRLSLLHFDPPPTLPLGRRIPPPPKAPLRSGRLSFCIECQADPRKAWAV